MRIDFFSVSECYLLCRSCIYLFNNLFVVVNRSPFSTFLVIVFFLLLTGFKFREVLCKGITFHSTCIQPFSAFLHLFGFIAKQTKC